MTTTENDNPKKIAIVVHAFYLPEWERIIHRIIPLSADDVFLFVTGPKDIINKIENSNIPVEHVYFLVTDNKGMDVLPFLTAIREFKLYLFDAVLKLHTKNQLSVFRRIQSDMSINALVNRDVFEWVREQPNGSANIFPAFLVRSVEDLMYGNSDYYNDFCSILNTAPTRKGRYFSAGTMFWIEGNRTQILADKYDAIVAIFNRHNGLDKTNADATPAHAMERAFSVLYDNNLHLSCRLDARDSRYQVVPHGCTHLFNRISQSGTPDHVHLYVQATQYSESLSKDDVFDESAYQASRHHHSHIISVVSPATHAILYGELENAYILNRISVPYYKLRYPAVHESKQSVFAHYLVSGRKSGLSAFPSYDEAQKIVKKYLVAAGRASEKNSSLARRLEKGSPHHLLCEDDYLAFHEFALKVLRYSDQYSLISRCIVHGDYKTALKKSRSFRHQYGDTFEALKCIAFASLVNGDFDGALKYYSIVSDKIACGEFRKESALFSAQLYRVGTEAATLFHRLSLDSDERPQKRERICVYTALFGKGGFLPQVNVKADNIDFICFSDRPRSAGSWRVVIKDKEYNDDEMNEKKFKILPHKYVESYNASLFVDADAPINRVVDIIENVSLLQADFAMYQPLERNDLLEEADATIWSGYHAPREIIEQIRCYMHKGLPRYSGMADTSFIWRKHHNETLQRFMNDWWDHLQKHSKKDELSLCYLMWQNNLRPSLAHL